MYKNSMDGMHALLLKKTCADSQPQAYIADHKNGQLDHKMDHLVCFMPGLLALGVAHRPDAPTAARDMQTAREVLSTCVRLYTMQATGVAAEYARFNQSSGCNMYNGAKHNLLRPETVESLMIMWRVTKDEQYRQQGWEIFQAFNRYCRVESGGFAGLKDVTNVSSLKDDTQQSFWLAETLKYLYLLFSPDEVIPLDKYVFNTEAHPLLIWTERG